MNPLSTKDKSYIEDFIEKYNTTAAETAIFTINIDSVPANIETAAVLIAIGQQKNKYRNKMFLLLHIWLTECLLNQSPGLHAN